MWLFFLLFRCCLEDLWHFLHIKKRSSKTSPFIHIKILFHTYQKRSSFIHFKILFLICMKCHRCITLALFFPSLPPHTHTQTHTMPKGKSHLRRRVSLFFLWITDNYLLFYHANTHTYAHAHRPTQTDRHTHTHTHHTHTHTHTPRNATGVGIERIERNFEKFGEKLAQITLELDARLTLAQILQRKNRMSSIYCNVKIKWYMYKYICMYI